MTTEKKDKIADTLMEFVLRVSKGEATPAETEVLPDIAKLLLEAAPFVM